MKLLIDIIDTTNEPNILQTMKIPKQDKYKYPLGNRGGKRINSGAKPKYLEQTKTVAFRCPLSKVDELKLIVKSKLSEWSVK